MIQLVGLIVAAYAMVRLVQVPIEHSNVQGKLVWLWIFSIGGIGVIGLLAIGLLVSGASSSLLPIK